MKILKKLAPDGLAIVVFLLISLFYFTKPISEGLVLGGHDTVASIGQGRELTEYLEKTGERSRWTGAMFSGMPTYQIAPAYKSDAVLSGMKKVYSLGTTGVLSYVFLYLLGFYVLMRAMRFSPLVSVLGAVVWAFSSYFFIIIAAGHIWKVLTLGFIPPTIAGLVLCYRGKLLLGGAVTATFTALQIWSNHVQMTYYSGFFMALMVLCLGVAAVRNPQPFLGSPNPLTLKRWAKATGVIVFAGLVGLCANLPNLYHTYAYSKYSMRGKAELTPLPSQGHAPTEGLDRDYITQWSYGIGETMTLMIPDFKGGGSKSILERENVEDLDGFETFRSSAYQFQQMTQGQSYPPGIMEYWGDQPFTVGPVYVGAIVCFLFVLGACWVSGPMKWALLLATALSFLFAWGKNFMPATDFFIDYLPMYNKFRTVSSALVIAEFTMPLLAMMALVQVLKNPEQLLGTKRGRISFATATALTAGVCLLIGVIPSFAGDCLSANDNYTFAAMLSNGFPADFTLRFKEAVIDMHHDILSGSAMRSACLILVAVVSIFIYLRKLIPAWVLALVLIVVSLGDMWSINKRYLNDDSFTSPTAQMKGFAMTPADKEILQDTSLSYRVANLGAGNPFNETTNETSYYHKSIGGYNAAKLHRYQDLIDRHLNRELSVFSSALQKAGADINQINMDSIAPVLNMLNTKYFIFGQKQQAIALQNPAHNGNGWFIKDLTFVQNADEEIAGLYGLNTKTSAVADKAFESVLQSDVLGEGTVELTFYEPNELHYQINSAQGGVVVFSEIFYPGWTAYIDGEPAELGRVNYVLRALRMPAGQHEVKLEFRPQTETFTTTVAYVAFLLIFAVIVAFLISAYRK
ncbi:MAG: YfhO family protein [Bacteroidaceae bacterium]|nr:YfhO family protein [Bacteroidaceae bacterium]